MAQPIRKADFEDPVLRALANAPQDEPETDEERAAVDEAMARREFVSSEGHPSRNRRAARSTRGVNYSVTREHAFVAALRRLVPTWQEQARNCGRGLPVRHDR